MRSLEAFIRIAHQRALPVLRRCVEATRAIVPDLIETAMVLLASKTAHVRSLTQAEGSFATEGNYSSVRPLGPPIDPASFRPAVLQTMSCIS